EMFTADKRPRQRRKKLIPKMNILLSLYQRS
ncbi:MAG: hypothetical protein ACI965_002475, partial [Paraglaciecola sp.]